MNPMTIPPFRSSAWPSGALPEVERPLPGGAIDHWIGWSATAVVLLAGTAALFF
jgi:hypothetical protein